MHRELLFRQSLLINDAAVSRLSEGAETFNQNIAQRTFNISNINPA